MKKELIIEGLMCVRCAARAQKALSAVEGVDSAVVDFESRTASVEGAALDVSALEKAVTEAGYKVVEIR